jgi:hypothetical protein
LGTRLALVPNEIAATNWDEYVALGTLALAGATLVLAVVSAWGVRIAKRSSADTRALAEAARDEVVAVSAEAEASLQQVSAARAALAASIQPVLAPLQIDEAGQERNPRADNDDVKTHVHEPDLFLSVPLRNVGTGVALVTDAYIEGDTSPRRLPGYVTKPAVPVSEKLRAEYRISLDTDRPLLDADPIWAVVQYTDAGGDAVFQTRAAVKETYHNVLEVIRVEVYRAGEPAPFLTVGTPIPW